MISNESNAINISGDNNAIHSDDSSISNCLYNIVQSDFSRTQQAVESRNSVEGVCHLRKNESPVWEYFNHSPNKGFVNCCTGNKCKMSLVYKDGCTSNLRRHLLTAHKLVIDDKIKLVDMQGNIITDHLPNKTE